ncbi:unnamed protein product, partial [Brassica oleracea var. botrytis]
AQIIQGFANPEHVVVLYNRDTGQSRGFTFVTMRNVRRSQRHYRKPRWNFTSWRLERAFRECGLNVVGPRVVNDGDTGKSRGYGFVCYSSKAEMETALGSLDGLELEGWAIRVNLTQGRNPDIIHQHFGIILSFLEDLQESSKVCYHNSKPQRKGQKKKACQTTMRPLRRGQDLTR